MSELWVDTFKNETGKGAPDFPNGITVTGVVTATTLSQNLNGDLTVTGNISAGGTITYEDVTNVDAIGIITARTGIKIGPSAGVAGTFYADGSYRTTGIVTATSFYGDGANLSNITSTTINTNADNRVITGSGTANTLNGESTLTYDGTILEISNSTPKVKLTDSDASGTPETLVDGSSGDLIFDVDRNNEKSNTILTAKIDGNEKIRLDHNGKFLIGTTADTAPWGMESRLQLCGVDGTGGKSSMSITRHSADSGGPTIVFGKSRGTGQSDQTLVQSADKLGSIYAVGADGNSWEPSSAIEFNVDTTPSTGTDMPGRVSFWTCPDDSDQLTERMRIDSAGNIGVKCAASGKADLRIYHSSNPTILLGSPQAANCGTIRFAEDPNWFGGGVKYDGNANLLRIFTNNSNSTTLDVANDVTGITLTRSGANVNIPTSLSKSSGSFRIDHPLDSKKDTHYLVHSFIEGPQADLIYRGVATLSSGTATVNIDTSAGMTEGTFVALCDDVSCFTSNETDWTAVKGSVSGNTLTITAQDNSSTAKVSWLVIGERKDPHMLSTPWTDSNGKVIVEPLKGSGVID